MHRFYKSVIEPILQAIKPRSIVEIGCDEGKNTELLLSFCLTADCVLYAIDPEPRFDPAKFGARGKKNFVFYKQLSLDALVKIDAMDVVLIDGDHNWYTVFNELKIIERKCRDCFPFILLHDIGWPYGRRDCYWSPDSIPVEFRQPFEKKGILPGRNTLVEGGFNDHMYNAVLEGGGKNGVLTAVEDFLRQASSKHKLLTLPGNFGLGMIVPGTLDSLNEEMAKAVSVFDVSGSVLEYLELLNQEHIYSVLSLDRIKKLHASDKLSYAAEMEKLQAKHNELADRLTSVTVQLRKQEDEKQNLLNAFEDEKKRMLDEYERENQKLVTLFETKKQKLQEEYHREINAQMSNYLKEVKKLNESRAKEKVQERKRFEDLEKQLVQQKGMLEDRYRQLEKRYREAIQSEGWKLVTQFRKLKKIPGGRLVFNMCRSLLKEARNQKHYFMSWRDKVSYSKYYLYRQLEKSHREVMQGEGRKLVKQLRRIKKSPAGRLVINIGRSLLRDNKNPSDGKREWHPTTPVPKKTEAPVAKVVSKGDQELVRRIYRHREIRKRRGRSKIAIYTACINNYDMLIQHQFICDEWDYFCITDRAIPGIYNWEFVQADYRNVDPVRSARYYKTHPHVLFPDYQYSIWIDSNIDIVGDHLKRRIEEMISSDCDLGCLHHPHWDCVYTEAAKCLEYGKGDDEAIMRQVDFLLAEGYLRNNGLIETSIMFRKHNQPRIVKLMNDWWKNICRFSRRDQMSFNYILQKHKVQNDWIIEEEGVSTRNHPHYRYHLHRGQESKAYQPYQPPYFNSNLPPLEDDFFTYRPNCSLRPLLQSDPRPSVDVILPVFNAPEEVKSCLASLENNRSSKYRLIIADDASEENTRRLLRTFSAGKNWVQLLENESNQGYCRNVNQALKSSRADFVIVLNSDTIVPELWVDKLLLCAYSSDSIGIVGPMSNAASWQSVPHIEDEDGVLAINALPHGMNLESVNRFLEERNLHPLYPKVHLLNGFCLGIKRKVFDKIGYFDEEAFPHGYGEEDDFCLRAIDAGFELAVATHTYVYHAKSKSYGSEKRKKLVKRAWQILSSRYGTSYLKNSIETSKCHPGLTNLRRLFQKDVRETPKAQVKEQNKSAKRSWTTIEIPEIQTAYEAPSLGENYESQRRYTGENEVRLLAFYLPQFYPFKENNEVWGEGFTEWTNVTRAMPLFKGHYQPKLPDVLGFYDTRLKDTLRRQIDLARQHGIYGFCFHHYFFGGRPVMRVPLNIFLQNRDLDFPFCLHWANEPWTTSWSYTYMDKRQDKIIIDQKHNEATDNAFIEDIRPALEDPRYIRVRGRPMLLIYRPGLFPNIRKTIKRWRRICRENGIGDLHLVMVQTNAEGEQDPRPLGFDAAVEFPPHLVSGRYLQKQMEFFLPDFDGAVIDYESIANASLHEPPPPYTRYRGIMPRWDNTPRKIRGTSIYVNDQPGTFQKWLEGLVTYSRRHLPLQERYIFINAWNEWAEGAFLEPDRRYGFAYLNACSRALENTNQVKPRFEQNQNEKIGIQIHAFHVDIFDKILHTINKNFPYDADLLISTTDEDKRAKIEKAVSEYRSGQVFIRVFPNRGRDIAPFIVGYADLITGYQYMIHLHTKKSSYNADLEGWFAYIINELIGSPERAGVILGYLASAKVGIVYPDHYPAIREKVKWGANLKRVNELLEGTGINLREEDRPMFPSGSMFYFRPAALGGLLAKKLGFDDFEVEAGQRDGTLAHAIERCFCYFAESAGYKTIVL